MVSFIIKQHTQIYIHFGEGDLAWTQAMLSVKIHGLGIRSMVQLVPSAFLASAAATSNLVHCIILSHLQGSPVPNIDDAKVLWSEGHAWSRSILLRMQPNTNRKHAWVTPKATALAKSLLHEECTRYQSLGRGRLLASTCTAKESWAWLNMLPISSLGLRIWRTMPLG